MLPKACYAEAVGPGAAPDDRTEHDVLAQAKAAVAAGDRAAALALLRQLQEGSSTVAQVTPALAKALVATARETADAEDQAARQVYAQVQEARRESIRVLHETPSIRRIWPPSGLPSTRRTRRSSRRLHSDGKKPSHSGPQRAGWAPAGWTRR
jgi:hypothetical protein